ncbi:MAG: response regulator [Candidatus Neomarinimicrobiota bacterium]
MPLILIIDDSSFQRETIGQAIRAIGYKTIEASDGQKGLEQITLHKPDCILTDLLMPNMGGLELLEVLNKQSVRIPVIIVTSNLQEGIRQRCRELGAAAVVDKPIDQEDLITNIQKVLKVNEADSRC